MSVIWITGGRGFIGRHLARLIEAEGNSVFGIGHGLWPAEEYSKWGFGGWCNGDVAAENFSRLLQISGMPDVVYHLAGGSSVGASFQSPHEDFFRTVESSARLLEWLRLHAPDVHLVCVSSAAVYGASHSGAIAENDVVQPYSPYGTHKFMMETLCHSYAENFGLQVTIIRLFSVYGSGLEKQLIWDLCCKLARTNDNAVTLGGSGNELRDWLHVADAASLLWLARNRCVDGSILNGGTGIATSIREVATLVSEAWGGQHRIDFSGEARSGDPFSLVADCNAAAHFGFRPAVTLSQGIEETVRWFKARR